MCHCKEVAIGSYDNQLNLKTPSHMKFYRENRNANMNVDLISVDTCLADEIKRLWDAGITTTGCCCGHNQIPAYIGVIEEDIPKMKNLGYAVAVNALYPEREDSFVPKTV